MLKQTHVSNAIDPALSILLVLKRRRSKRLMRWVSAALLPDGVYETWLRSLPVTWLPSASTGALIGWTCSALLSEFISLKSFFFVHLFKQHQCPNVSWLPLKRCDALFCKMLLWRVPWSVWNQNVKLKGLIIAFNCVDQCIYRCIA